MSDHTGEPLTVEFKSIPEYWEKEEAGQKPNTERVMDAAPTTVRAALASGQAVRIRITNTQTMAVFERGLTDVSVIGSLCGKVIVVWSWQHE